LYEKFFNFNFSRESIIWSLKIFSKEL
jgi:hypothetical protein